MQNSVNMSDLEMGVLPFQKLNILGDKSSSVGDYAIGNAIPERPIRFGRVSGMRLEPGSGNPHTFYRLMMVGQSGDQIAVIEPGINEAVSDASMPITFSIVDTAFTNTRVGQRPIPQPMSKIAWVPHKSNEKLESAIARLNDLAAKSNGWKGPDSVSMPKETLRAAETFLIRYFVSPTMLAPFVGLDSDGDVTLFWKTDQLIVDLSISSDGLYSFYANVKGVTSRGDDIPADKELPFKVRFALSQTTR